MSSRSIVRSAAIAAAALATVGMFAPSASAQTYSYQGGYGQAYDYGQRGYRDDRYRDSYDYCRDDRGQRQGAGAVFGGAAGAIAGSQLAARGRRTEGSILGGVVGAVIGSAVGRSSSQNCDVRYNDRSYDSRYDDRAYDNRYNDTVYVAPRYDDRYDSRYNDDRYNDRRYVQIYPSTGYGSDYSSSYSSSYRSDDGCRLAESRIRLPDGRSETRYVRSCPDQSGRYRVVD